MALNDSYPPMAVKFEDSCICAVQVKEAEDGEPLIPGKVLIAQGKLHLQLRRSG